MKICVLGLWHLGSVTAACMAAAGHDVTGIDPDAQNVQQLGQGKAPLFEPGLDDLLAQGLAAGRLRFSTQTIAARDAQLLWVTCDTPVDEDDRADVESVIAQVEAVLPELPADATVLVSSQLPLGSVARLEQSASRLCPASGLHFAASPENLRLGKALDVFRRPDRIVVGARDDAARACVADALAPLEARIEWMSVESAEMTKHAINAFLATSVVFANELAALCEVLGADAKEVERGLKTESRIGAGAYVSPGGAFAGGTLARDVQFLNQFGQAHGLDNALLSSIRQSNDQHKQWATRRLRELLGSVGGKVIAVWGLTYKPGTDTLRRSTSVELCDQLLAQGAMLQVHDPAVAQLPAAWAGKVTRCGTPEQALAGAAALVVATQWPEYRAIDPDTVDGLQPGLVVLDANRFMPAWQAVPGVRYAGVGTPLEMRS